MYHHNVVEPMKIIAFDCLGPLPATPRDKKHVILGIDMFTRFVITKAVKRIDSATFSRFLIQCIGQLGAPNGILTDNAPTSLNSQVQSLTKMLNIQHFRSTPHHSRGYSVAERAIQTLQEKISLISCDEKVLGDWSKALPLTTLTTQRGYLYPTRS